MWLVAHIVPVHKKGITSDVANYRPISLTCVASKVLRRVIAKCILDHLTHNTSCTLHNTVSASVVPLVLTLWLQYKPCIYSMSVTGVLPMVTWPYSSDFSLFSLSCVVFSSSELRVSLFYLYAYSSTWWRHCSRVVRPCDRLSVR